jgi:ABC-2 type transport system permease protein
MIFLLPKYRKEQAMKNNTFLVIQREFITRVRKKSFIVMTIIGPLLFAAMMLVPIWLALRETTDERIVKVKDESGIFTQHLGESSGLVFQFTNEPDDSLKSAVLNSDLYGGLIIPNIDIYNPEGIEFFSSSNPSLEVLTSMEQIIEGRLEEIKLEKSGLSRSKLDSLQSSVNINTINISEKGEKETNAGIATIVGYIFSFLIYFFIFLYGAQVMRGVIEEKSNRIVEVIVSAVKPFQLMMGKIVGVASVGLAQFLLWVLLTIGITTLVMGALDLESVSPPQMEQAMQEGGQDFNKMKVAQTLDNVFQLPIATIIIGFIIYFLGGYLMYGALFAAVGSAADSDTDTQQFMLPITVPLIFSILVLSAVLKEPDGSLAFWLSIIPFTSPIVMMMRIPFEVPTWQLVLSIILLFAGFVFTTWVASRIYRIGILMHGSKVNYKVLGKWLMMKQ